MSQDSPTLELTQLESLLEPGEFPWLLGPDLVCLFMGEEAGRLLGAPAGHFPGLAARDIFTPSSLAAIQSLQKGWQEPGGPAAPPGPLALTFAAGRGVEVVLSSRLVPWPGGGILGLSRAAAPSRLSSEVVKALDALQEPVLLVSPSGLVVRANQAAAAWLGLPLEGLEGRELVSLGGESQQGTEVLELLGRAAAQALDLAKPAGQTDRAPNEEGEAGDLSISAQAVVAADGGHLVVISLLDLSGQRRMEEMIAQLSVQLEEMVGRRTDRLSEQNLSLVRLDRMRRDLTAMVVHDMKSPLAEVMGNLSVLARRVTRADDLETLQLAQAGAEDLKRMILNLLDVERLKEGRLKVRPEPLDFAELAASVVGKFTNLIRMTDMNVTWHDRGGHLTADPHLLERVLMNLVSNSLNHAPEGGRISLAMSPRPDGLPGAVISVADNGEGIPPEKLETIFDRFTQGHEEAGNGTGLGLTFCSMAVAAHGGRIWAQSEPGAGSTFFLEMPLRPERPQETDNGS